jgi:hypothetical protein
MAIIYTSKDIVIDSTLQPSANYPGSWEPDITFVTDNSCGTTNIRFYDNETETDMIKRVCNTAGVPYDPNCYIPTK